MDSVLSGSHQLFKDWENYSHMQLPDGAMWHLFREKLNKQKKKREDKNHFLLLKLVFVTYTWPSTQTQLWRQAILQIGPNGLEQSLAPVLSVSQVNFSFDPIFRGELFLLNLFFSTQFSGVLPLWVIPAKALGTAPSAPAEDNLRYLLAFAGHSCLFLLPCMPVSDVDIQRFFLQLAVYLVTFSFISSQKHINM